MAENRCMSQTHSSYFRIPLARDKYKKTDNALSAPAQLTMIPGIFINRSLIINGHSGRIAIGKRLDEEVVTVSG